MPIPVCQAIEPLRVNVIQIAHCSGEIAQRCLKQEMIVVGHQAESMDLELPHFRCFGETFEKQSVVAGMIKNFLPRVAAVHDMINSAGILNAKRPRHSPPLTVQEERVNT